MNVQIKNKKIIKTILYNRYLALVVKSYLISNLNLSIILVFPDNISRFQVIQDPFTYHNKPYIHTDIIGFDLYKSRNVYLKILEIVVY